MSAPSKVNKENFRLLDLSSDEESDDLQLEIIPSRKKKVTRRERSRGASHPVPEANIGAEVQCALRWAVRGTLLLWLLMLTWICAGLYDHVSTMRSDISQVSRSSEQLNNELQLCHTTTKELHESAATLKDRLDDLEQRHNELVKRVDNATSEFAKVASQLSAAPKLADTPRRLAELQRTVADIGSQVSSFDGSINSARKQVVTAVTGVEDVRNLLHQLDAKTNDTIANITANIHREDEFRDQLTALNATLTAKVDALQNRIQEMSKPVSTAAPVVAPAQPASAAAAANVTATPIPPTPTPGPPTKPAAKRDIHNS